MIKKRYPKRWYREVSRDINKLPDAIEWYEDQLEKAFEEVDISGNLMRANQDQAGFIAYYDAMHTDLDAILTLMERNWRQEKARITMEYADSPPTNVKLGASESKLVVEMHPDVILAHDAFMEVNYLYKQYSSLLKGFEQRGYTLNNITKLRTANMEEVEV